MSQFVWSASSFGASYSRLWLLPAAFVTWKALVYLQTIIKCWMYMPPGPRGVPLLGNVFQLKAKRPWALLTDWRKEFGPIYALSIAGIPVIVLNTVEAATDLLERRAHKYSDRLRSIMAGELMTSSQLMLFTQTGPLLSRLRRAAHDGLNIRSVKKFSPLQEREAALLIFNLLNNPADLNEELRRTIASVILSVLYGWQPLKDYHNPVVSKILEILHEIEHASLPGTFLIDIFPWLLYIPKRLSKWKQIGRRFYHKSTTFFEGLMDEVRQKRDQLPDCIAMSLMDKVDAGNMSHSEAAWLAGVVFAAGVESTGQTVAMFLLAACFNQDIMRRAQDEVDLVVGRERMPTFEDYDKLPYVAALVKEVTRWISISFVSMPRQCQEDDWYKGYYIPKGSIVMPNIWAIHRDPILYPDPHLFKPERFLDETGKLEPALTDTHGQGHVTFGFGKRLCPGLHLANQTLFIDIVSLLWAFDIRNPTYLDGKPILSVEDVLVAQGIVIGTQPFHCEFHARFPEVGDTVEIELAKRS